MSIDYKLIGSRIKSERIRQKITQEKLAESLDVSVGYVSQLERGITKISLDRLSEISDLLGTDITYFLSGSSIDGNDYLMSDIHDVICQLPGDRRLLLYQILKLINDSGI